MSDRPYALSDGLTVVPWEGNYALTVEGEEADPDRNGDQILLTSEELDALMEWWLGMDDQ
jgi:hypothetical protein